MKHLTTMFGLPPGINLERAGEVFRVDYAKLAQAALSMRHEVTPSSEDRFRIAVIDVDNQNTFGLPSFELPVQGAIEDAKRAAAFDYRYVSVITRHYDSLDSHDPIQIFHPIFWIQGGIGEHCAHPSGGTVITAADLDGFVVNRAVAPILKRPWQWLENYVRHYMQTLEDEGKPPLVIWPYHAMNGGIGNALMSIIEESLFFHSILRSTNAVMVRKGQHPLTEFYGMFTPEVTFDHEDNSLGQFNDRLADDLSKYHMTIWRGQAMSHCVARSLQQYVGWLQHFGHQDIVQRTYLLEDCASPVVIPGVIDFTAQAEAAKADLAKRGVKIVRSTTPMEEWPGVQELLDEVLV